MTRAPDPPLPGVSPANPPADLSYSPLHSPRIPGSVLSSSEPSGEGARSAVSAGQTPAGSARAFPASEQSTTARAPLPSTSGYPAQILGIGVDLAEPSRVARAIKNRRFVERVFAREEIDAYAGETPDLDGLARAFALKEALLKAIGTGWTDGVGFHEVVGPPVAASGTLELRGKAGEVARRLGVKTVYASSCRMNDVAIGTVILVG